MIDVTVLLLGGCYASTALGPVEVFHSAGRLWNVLHGDAESPRFRVTSASLRGRRIESPYGVGLVADVEFREVRSTDLIVVPSAGLELDAQLETHRDIYPWLRRQAAKGAYVAGVCVGAAYLAAAGLLDGREATTHWASAQELPRRFPAVKWRPDEMITEEFADGPASTWGYALPRASDGGVLVAGEHSVDGMALWRLHGDGSLDTAWFTQPYATNPPGKTGRYSGFQQIPDEVLDAAFDKYWATDLQLNMHMNGDAAADQALRAIDKAIAKHGMRDHRPVFVHGTYLRPDQIARLKEVGAVPSSLTTGVTTGGDPVLRLWGPDRASRAMAAQTLSQAGVPFTFSHDAPVTPQPWILPLVDAGVKMVPPDKKVGESELGDLGRVFA